MIQNRRVPKTREQLLDALVRPLEGNFEQRESARRWIDDTLVVQDADFLPPLKRLRAVDEAGGGKWRKWSWLGLLIVSVIGWLSFIPEVRMLRMVPGTFMDTGPFFGDQTLERIVARKLTGDELLLIGDPNKSGLKQKEALWESAPGNPAFFAEYLLQYEKIHHGLPSDYSEVANRIDPDNAWFDCFAAASLSRKSVERVKQTSAEKIAKKPRQWRILDEARMLESLALIRNTRGKSHLNSYEALLMRKRIPLLPQERFIERIASINYLAGTTSAMIGIRNVSEVIAARAWQLGEVGDVENFRQLREDGVHLVDLLLETEPTSLVNQLIVAASGANVTKSLQAAAVKLEVAEESLRLKLLNEGFERYYERREKRRKGSRSDLYLAAEAHGSLLVALTIPATTFQVESPPPLAMEDLKPGRMADFAVVGMLAMLAIWPGLALGLLGAYLYRFRISSPLRAVSTRILLLLKPADWGWIFAVGILLPVMAVIIITHFTPFGGNEMSLMSLRKTGSELPFNCYLILFLALMVFPILSVRWRLADKAGALGIRAGRSIWGWLAVVSLIGLIFSFFDLTARWFLVALLLVTLIWFLFVWGRALFGRGSASLLPRATVARALEPCFIVAMACLIIAAFSLKGLHQYWFERDDLTRLKADAPGMIPYEYQVAEQLKAEIDAAIGE